MNRRNFLLSLPSIAIAASLFTAEKANDYPEYHSTVKALLYNGEVVGYKVEQCGERNNHILYALTRLEEVDPCCVIAVPDLRQSAKSSTSPTDKTKAATFSACNLHGPFV